MVDLAWVDASGLVRQRVRMANERGPLLRVIRLWAKHQGLVLEHCLFSLEKLHPWNGAVVQVLIDHALRLGLLDATHVREDLALPDDREIEAEHLAEHARTSPHRVQLYDDSQQDAERLEHLQRRRRELTAMREEYFARIADPGRHAGNDLKREFERMDKRYVEVMDRLLARINVLMGMHLTRIKEISQGAGPGGPSTSGALTALGYPGDAAEGPDQDWASLKGSAT